jgi:recombinational DNA repair ATPase RecF
MYIKQITLSNFRSFYTQPELQPAFSAHTNAVVGRNGSGKSNLFDAVQFVLLAPRFANLRQVRRRRRSFGASPRNGFSPAMRTHPVSSSCTHAFRKNARHCYTKERDLLL